MLLPLIISLLVSQPTEPDCVDVLVYLNHKQATEIPFGNVYKNQFFVDGKSALLVRIDKNDVSKLLAMTTIESVHIALSAGSDVRGFLSHSESQMLSQIFQNPSDGLNQFILGIVSSIYQNPIEGWRYVASDRIGVEPASFGSVTASQMFSDDRSTDSRIDASLEALLRDMHLRVVSQGMVLAILGQNNAAAAFQLSIAVGPGKNPSERRVLFFSSPSARVRYHRFETHKLAD